MWSVVVCVDTYLCCSITATIVTATAAATATVFAVLVVVGRGAAWVGRRGHRKAQKGQRSQYS